MAILITGGAGYLGSHTAVRLLEKENDVIVMDNFTRSSAEQINRITAAAGRAPEVEDGDVKTKEDLERVFQKYNVEAVIHFAGLKAAGESVEKPLLYYRENLQMTLCLLEIMEDYQVKKLIFSSSAAVYGNCESMPVSESTPKNPINPYGHSKAMIEQMLEDIAQADPAWQITALRYFNPVGAHPSIAVGENPAGTPANLMPILLEAAAGERDAVDVYGTDYDTKDGTGIRDYIHVMDLADGHIAAAASQKHGFHVYNLGTGRGTTVLELINMVERVSGKHIAWEAKARRPGDPAENWADASRAERELGWKASCTLEEMCLHAWKWKEEMHKNTQKGE
ncbi:UDP-glucose 4-epimerase GalE [Alkalicoccus urumqiensis]|uniref:UDP-glucose 4-epimerase n=1 Tax=Alkalicoccus urumqiensis TaxID=1548213 RepID=A0A2P6MET9_ALKUR|nr:UDP-glucose 4-epimerase GalE [Alkalicoccus urumqiensis]PRO64798.1 UDP-glucose 4-epimerase GalE [Alkalicoccus urumqiensis]